LEIMTSFFSYINADFLSEIIRSTYTQYKETCSFEYKIN